MTVLIVEDAPRVRARLREHLEPAGVRVLEARDGDEAGALARDGAKDIAHVIVDVHVPGIGIAGLTALRRALPAVVMIVLTNEASAQHHKECLAHGADFFFDKSHEFERAISIVLGGG